MEQGPGSGLDLGPLAPAPHQRRLGHHLPGLALQPGAADRQQRIHEERCTDRFDQIGAEAGGPNVLGTLRLIH